MSFIAGIISRSGILEDISRQRFLDSFMAMKTELPWPTEIRENSKYIFARADFPYMWQGPKMLSGKNYDAVATGVQWRKIPDKRTALEYLTSVLLTEDCEIGNYFDYFSCAIIDNNSDRCILATDPLGMSPVLYTLNNEVLVFSSHQSFLRRYLDRDIEINWQAVFERLTTKRILGDKTLLKNISVLSPGCKLEIYQNKSQITRYIIFDNVNIKKEMTLDEATNLIFEHMKKKIEGYSELSSKDFACFLSGGWDTRFIASLLARTGKLAMTYTTQQSGVIFNNRLISERKIAKEVANFLGVPNQYISPSSKTEKSRNDWLRIMDYVTGAHSWSFAMTERLPYDRFILVEGFLGDAWLRDGYLTDQLWKCIVDKDRDTAIKILYSKYLNGFHWYMLPVKAWEKVINPRYLNEFVESLKREIAEGIHDTHSEDFISSYLFKTRGRKGTNCLPMLIFGRKGSVILPFCDFEFVQKALSIPIEYKLDHSLYKALLERSKPGLSSIASTNTKDADKLKPYLYNIVVQIWQTVSMIGMISMVLKRYPRLHRVGEGVLKLVFRIRDSAWAKEVITNPPLLFMDVLTPELKQAIENGDVAYVRKHRSFLEDIMLLNSFLAGEEI